MTTFIALLRGVNVGGKNTLPMQALRDAMSAADFFNVRTYIQSGNIVFEMPDAEQNKPAQEDSENLRHAATLDIQAIIEEKFAFTPKIIILTPSELQVAINNNPYQTCLTELKHVHLYFLASIPTIGNYEKLQNLCTNNEECRLINNVFYLHAPDGIARSKVAASVERILKTGATARNLNSASKILALTE